MSKPMTPPPAVQQQPKCFKDGCEDWGSYGFKFPGGRQEWTCGTHRAEMDAAWTVATQAKLDEDAERLKPAQGRLL